MLLNAFATALHGTEALKLIVTSNRLQRGGILAYKVHCGTTTCSVNSVQQQLQPALALVSGSVA